MIGQDADQDNPYLAYFKTKRTHEAYLRCPSIDESTYGSYGTNTPGRTSYVLIRATYKNQLASLQGVPLSKATAPGRTILMIERHATATTNAPTGVAATYSTADAETMRSAYRLFSRHNKGINAVFMDNHVKRMSWDNGSSGSSLVRNANGTGSGDFDPLWFTIDK
jgi:prepilin-type processing-associated H-X9-DG protein